jgi:hypothetical protein
MEKVKNNKLKWEVPELVGLNSEEAKGDVGCGSGSSAFTCGTGGIAKVEV